MMTALRRRPFIASALLVLATAATAVAADDEADDDPGGAPTLTAHPPDVQRGSGVPAAPDAGESQAGVPFGFYKDRQGRVMQVSFDLQKRAWLGVAYAPRRRQTGTTEIAPA